MQAGRLPHLARLAEQGTFTELGRRCSISPVASVVYDRVNPGKHNIFIPEPRSADYSSFRVRVTVAVGGVLWRLGLGKDQPHAASQPF